MFFYCGLLSLPNEENYESLTSNHIRPENISFHQFLQNIVIYLVSVLYVASRLFTTLNLIYIPLYINERTENGTNLTAIGDRQAIASFPLVCYLASLVTALLLKFQTSKVKRN